MVCNESRFASLMEIINRPSLVFVRGEGSWLYDEAGEAYLDFLQGWAVNSLGHCPPEVVRAIQEQASLLLNPSPAFYNTSMIRLADLIVQNSVFDRVFFANSGAEANEGAVKLARKWGSINKGGAYEIVTFERAFHGRTLAMMSASGKPQWRELFEPKVPGFPKAVINNLDSVLAVLGDRTVGIMLEPIQGEAGVYPATEQFMQDLRSLCEERKLLLIFDEVQTGVGRTGNLFCYQSYDIEPDMMTLGKGIGSGVPLAALCAKEHVSCFAPGDQGGTYNGNPLMTAAGCAVFEKVLSPGFLDQVKNTGSYLSHKLRELKEQFPIIGDVRGCGLLLAVHLHNARGSEIVELARARHLLLNSPNPSTLRFVPSLTVSSAEIDQMTDILAQCLGEMS
jgi:acetylornithine/N-succinyldiaminopimelate aminotransferase